MTTQDTTLTPPTDAEKLAAAADVLQDATGNFQSLAAIIHRALASLSWDEDADAAGLHAAAALAEMGAALTDRAAIACGAVPVRGGFDEWVLTPRSRAAMRTLESAGATPGRCDEPMGAAS